MKRKAQKSVHPQLQLRVKCWLGVQDSNLGLRFQRPLSYH